MIEEPATVCSDYCFGEAYGETVADARADDRRPGGVEDDETEEKV
jgi:hypothetical protein